MRMIHLVLVFALLGATSAAAKSKSTRKPDVGTGNVAWFDLASTDLKKSKDFYGQLFGWGFKPIQGTDLAVEITNDGVSIGSLRSAEGKYAPYNGVTYIQVPDIQASCAKARELGGTIPQGFPFNIPGGGGAISLLVDPVGHPIGMYSHKPMPEKK